MKHSDTPIRRRLRHHWFVQQLVAKTDELIESELWKWQRENDSDTIYGMTISPYNVAGRVFCDITRGFSIFE